VSLQCAKFHILAEFDGNRRTCTERLSHHNACRRQRRRAMAEAEAITTQQSLQMPTGRRGRLVARSKSVDDSDLASVIVSHSGPCSGSTSDVGSGLGSANVSPLMAPQLPAHGLNTVTAVAVADHGSVLLGIGAPGCWPVLAQGGDRCDESSVSSASHSETPFCSDGRHDSAPTSIPLAGVPDAWMRAYTPAPTVVMVEGNHCRSYTPASTDVMVEGNHCRSYTPAPTDVMVEGNHCRSYTPAPTDVMVEGNHCRSYTPASTDVMVEGNHCRSYTPAPTDVAATSGYNNHCGQLVATYQPRTQLSTLQPLPGAFALLSSSSSSTTTTTTSCSTSDCMGVAGFYDAQVWDEAGDDKLEQPWPLPLPLTAQNHDNDLQLAPCIVAELLEWMA
jgi:SBP domain